MSRPRKPRTGDPELDAMVLALVDVLDGGDEDIATELLGNAVRLMRENHARGDRKIAAASLREMRRAFKVFEPHRSMRKCAVFGSARTPPDDPAYAAARAVAAGLAAIDWMIITGGGPGIMDAGVKGAGPDHAFAVSIRLPFESSLGADGVPDDQQVRFRYFFTRKLTFMKESDAYVIFPGGFGTLDETFELLTLMQTGKEYPAPIVLFETPGEKYWSHWRTFIESELADAGLVSGGDLGLVHITDDVDDAVQFVDRFYDRYHSMRYVGDELVIRMTSDVDDDELARLNRDYSALLVEGTIARTGPLDDERRDLDLLDLPRLRLRFNDRSFALLHEMICSL